MTYNEVKKTRMYAQEFLDAVREMEADKAHDQAKKRGGALYASKSSGLVRCWSLILSRQLSKMRNS